MSEIQQLLTALKPGERFGVAPDLLPEVFPTTPQLEAFCRQHGLFWEVQDSGRVVFDRPREGTP